MGTQYQAVNEEKQFLLDKYLMDTSHVQELLHDYKIPKGRQHLSFVPFVCEEEQLQFVDTERTPLLQETVSDVEEAEEYTLDHLESALEHLEPFASHTPSLIDNTSEPALPSLYEEPMAKMTSMDTDDLSQLVGPLNEDTVVKTLQGRFNKGLYTSKIGPVYVLVNPNSDEELPQQPLDAIATGNIASYLDDIIHSAINQQMETRYSQVIILSGENGCGKTYTSSLLLRQLYDIAGGGSGTDSFKHLNATLTVLRSLGSATTDMNPESSRVGYFYEVQLSDGMVHRTKIHSYFIDQRRIVSPISHEKNYHIFYQMMAGLSREERVKLHLQNQTIQSLEFLKYGSQTHDEGRDKQRFLMWKSALSLLGIPFYDIMRVMAAILLLGNIQFIKGNGGQLDTKSNTEIKSVAALLGISGVALYRGLTTKTHLTRNQRQRLNLDLQTANQARNALAKSLYHRSVLAVVRRANSLKRPNPMMHSPCSTDSNDSANFGYDYQNMFPPSNSGLNWSRHLSSKESMRKVTKTSVDGFIGILDMFGYECSKVSNSLEQLCINLCAETIQHFYNTHIFKAPLQGYRDEGLDGELTVNYTDNVPVIELISSQTVGILYILDRVCDNSEEDNVTETLTQQMRAQHGNSEYFYSSDSTDKSLANQFSIIHHTGQVVYDASDFVCTNRDELPDDTVTVFSKHSCNFGFVTHLFGNELKAMQGAGPRGEHFRISPCLPGYDCSEYKGTMSQDFHIKLNNLLKTLVHAKPHFIRCIKSNSQGDSLVFDQGCVQEQVRALQVVETVNLMAGGLPHRMRYRAFCTRYGFLLPYTKRKAKDPRAGENWQQKCKIILDNYLKLMDESNQPYTSANWVWGNKYIFFSESARQQFESARTKSRITAAITIQSNWRCMQCVKNWPILKRQLEARKTHRTPPYRGQDLIRKSRPNPIMDEKDTNQYDYKMFKQMCNMYGIDLQSPPPPPPNKRSYSIVGNMKIGFPQTRVMKEEYTEGTTILYKGEEVVVLGPSHARRGRLIVEHSQNNLHVPYYAMDIKFDKRVDSTYIPDPDEGVCI